MVKVETKNSKNVKLNDNRTIRGSRFIIKNSLEQQEVEGEGPEKYV